MILCEPWYYSQASYTGDHDISLYNVNLKLLPTPYYYTGQTYTVFVMISLLNITVIYLEINTSLSVIISLETLLTSPRVLDFSSFYCVFIVI